MPSGAAAGQCPSAYTAQTKHSVMAHVREAEAKKHDSEPLPDTDSVSGSSESAVVVVAVGVVSSGKHDTVLV